MVQQSSKAIVMTTLIIIAVSATALLPMFNSDNPVVPNTSGISTLTISGNSTDLLYPELMEARFVFLENGSWLVNAHFVNGSAGYYEFLEIYDRNFTATSEEVQSIDGALYEGLNLTYSSNLSALALLESCPSIWYDIEITYTDGSWIYITAFQTDQGHIIYNSGTGTPDGNLLSGTVIEPLSALDCLVLAIYNLFSNHLE